MRGQTAEQPGNAPNHPPAAGPGCSGCPAAPPLSFPARPPTATPGCTQPGKEGGKGGVRRLPGLSIGGDSRQLCLAAGTREWAEQWPQKLLTSALLATGATFTLNTLPGGEGGGTGQEKGIAEGHYTRFASSSVFVPHTTHRHPHLPARTHSLFTCLCGPLRQLHQYRHQLAALGAELHRPPAAALEARAA